MKTLLSILFTYLFIQAYSQKTDIPVRIKLIDGGSIEAVHFGQLKCGNSSSFMENYIFIKGKFMGNVTEITKYSDIKEITLEGYTAGPEASKGNQKGTVHIQKIDGNIFMLEEAEISLSCYSVGDKYNQIIVQVMNPINKQRTESAINIRDINSIEFIR